MKRDVYLGAIRYSFGELNDMRRLQLDATSEAQLRKRGFQFFSQISESFIDQAQECAFASLRDANLDADKIDMVLIASNAYNYWPNMEKNVQKIVCQLGLVGRPIIGINHTLCSNFLSALLIANQFVAYGAAQNILILVIDAFPPEVSRVGANYKYLMSDCISSCCVSSAPLSYRVAGAVQAGTAESDVNSATDPAKRLQNLFTSLTHVRREIAAKFDIDTATATSLVVENFTDDLIALLSKLLGVETDRTFFHGRLEHGHAAASDILVNLANCTEKKSSSGAAEDQLIVLVTSSSMATALVALTPCT
jgi:3-oxoacyl-[acyl-carrier-protein] synthase III